MATISFKLPGSSSSANRLKKPASSLVPDADHGQDEQQKNDYIIQVDKKGIRSELSEEAKLLNSLKKKPVIPCPKDDFRVALEELRPSVPSGIEAEAVSALLQDAAAYAAGDDNRHGQPKAAATLVIEQTTDDTDAPGTSTPGGLPTVRGVVVSDVAADYDSVAIDDFGLAMIRGMGWNEGGGIGKTNNVFVKPLEVQLRPKGLGLGADTARVKAKMEALSKSENGHSSSASNLPALELKKGGFGVILSGQHCDKYGTVDGFDPDNAQVIMKLVVGGDTIRINELAVKPVTREEFSKFGKYINKASADKARQESEKRMQVIREDAAESKKTSNHEVIDVDKDDGNNGDGRHHRHHHHHSHDKHRHHRRSRSRSRSPKSHRRDKHSAVPWLHSNMAVLYDQKQFIVADVLTPTSCSLRPYPASSSNHRIVAENVPDRSLKPLPPRTAGQVCIILSGSNKDKPAEVMKLNDGDNSAMLQLLIDDDDVDQSIVVERLSNLCLVVN